MIPQKQQAIAKKDEEPGVVKLVRQFRGQIEQSLPKHMTGDRMIRVVLNEFRRTPKLLDCVAESVVGAIVQASQAGLEIGGVLGHAYLVPFGKECQFVPGYKGLEDLTRRTGKVKGIWAEKVLAGDKFFWGVRGGVPDLTWEPNADIDRDDDSLITHAFCVSRFDDGSTSWSVCTKAEIDKIKNGRKNKFDGVWDLHYGEMAKKTAIRRHMKTLPMSPEAADAIEADNAAYEGKSQRNFFDVTKGAIDVTHDILPPNHDPDKIVAEMAEAAAEANPYDKKAQEAKALSDKNKAIAEYQHAYQTMRSLGGEPDIYLGKSTEQVLRETSGVINALTDKLNRWINDARAKG